VVTFALAVGDPLFVVDLRDPAHPMVAGELKIPGYSTYLHDAGDGRLIGVGWDDGLQVSLFDVSDPAHPKRTSQVVVPDAWGGQQFDPHSFLFWEPTGLVVVPVGGGSSAQRALVTRLHGGTLTEQGTVANQAGAVQRSLIVDGQLWTVSEQGIRVSEELTLLQKAWIAFS
ncbi:MAG TPA: beta-propeller domain-containing protein, partial [Jatrophihabitantaceae bacterium]|nr:beta-propeller domain-containing protein [Jatrophihabitantaceae bacterium]